jgi:ribosomal protein S18
MTKQIMVIGVLISFVYGLVNEVGASEPEVLYQDDKVKVEKVFSKTIEGLNKVVWAKQKMILAEAEIDNLQNMILESQGDTVTVIYPKVICELTFDEQAKVSFLNADGGVRKELKGFANTGNDRWDFKDVVVLSKYKPSYAEGNKLSIMDTEGNLLWETESGEFGIVEPINKESILDNTTPLGVCGFNIYKRDDGNKIQVKSVRFNALSEGVEFCVSLNGTYIFGYGDQKIEMWNKEGVSLWSQNIPDVDYKVVTSMLDVVSDSGKNILVNLRKRHAEGGLVYQINQDGVLINKSVLNLKAQTCPFHSENENVVGLINVDNNKMSIYQNENLANSIVLVKDFEFTDDIDMQISCASNDGKTIFIFYKGKKDNRLPNIISIIKVTFK